MIKNFLSSRTPLFMESYLQISSFKFCSNNKGAIKMEQILSKSNQKISVDSKTGIQESSNEGKKEQNIASIKESVFSDFKGDSIDKPIAERDIQLPLPDSKEYKLYMSVIKSLQNLDPKGEAEINKIMNNIKI